MSYIFFDESGDLGFDFSKKRTSRYFVVTFLFTPEKRSIEQAVKKAFTTLSSHDSKGHAGVLHAVNELPKTRLKLLRLLVQKDVRILALYLDKTRVYTQLKDEREVLYDFVTNMLLDRIMSRKLVPTAEPITLIASRRETSRFLNRNFKNYLEDTVKRNHNILLTVEIKTPYQEKGLQAADFVSWSLFRRLEYGDTTYYDIFKENIVEQSSLYSL